MSSFESKYIKNGGYTKTTPKVWSDEEIEFLKEQIKAGKPYSEIAVMLDRSEVSVSIKAKRLTKKEKTYNEKHIDEKYMINRKFLEYIQPKSIIDAYSGDKSFYDGFSVIANDKNKDFSVDYNMDALQFMCLMYANGEKADLIDLDPFGSAYDCFDLAVKMANKGLCVTLGELGHKRWKRLDYVGRYYGIESLEDFTIDRLIEHIKMIGRRNKKELTVFAKREWQNIGRVWFEIKPLKITSQWEVHRESDV